MYDLTLRSLYGVGLFGFALALGCGQAGDDRPKTYPVTGVVTYNGDPVEGATVALQSTAGGQGAFGVTDAGGRYTLTTYTSGDGAAPGQYKVKVTKVKAAQAGSGGDTDSPDYVPPTAEDAPPAEPENLLPAKYADPSTSGLTATVAESDNTVNFDLTD